MNWSKAKSILIIFFLLMNIVLFCNIVYSANKATIITPEILNSTVEVLKKNDIQINPDIIPAKTHNVPYIETNNIITSNKEFADKILGEASSEDNLYTSKNASLEFEGDYFTLSCHTPLFPDIVSGINIDNAEDIAIKILKQYDIALGDYICEVSISDNNFVVLFTKKISSYPVFDAKIKMIISPDGLNKIWGKWFNETSIISIFSEKTELNSITSTLVEFILNEKRPKTPIEISALNLGYCIADDNIYHKSVVLTPSWEIILDDNSTYCVDARGNQ